MPVNENLAYYEHNASAYAKRTRSRLDRDALQAFSHRVLPQGRVLDAGCGSGRDLRELIQAGFQAEGVDFSPAMVEIARTYSSAPVACSDLQMLSLKRENLDGIWAHRVLIHLPPPSVQRVMGTFFAALKPGGILFTSIEEGQGTEEDRFDDPNGPARRFYLYPSNEFASLLRQSGFQLLAQGKNLEASRQIGFIARRL